VRRSFLYRSRQGGIMGDLNLLNIHQWKVSTKLKIGTFGESVFLGSNSQFRNDKLTPDKKRLLAIWTSTT
jgi:hypothetical protein